MMALPLQQELLIMATLQQAQLKMLSVVMPPKQDTTSREDLDGIAMVYQLNTKSIS